MQRNELEDDCEECPGPIPKLPWKFECHLCNKKLCEDCRFNCPDCRALVCSQHSWFCQRCDAKSCFDCNKPLILFDNPEETHCNNCLDIMENEADIDNDLMRVVEDGNYVSHRKSE